MNIEQFRKQKHYVGTVSTYKDLREDTDYVIEIFDTAIRELTKDELKPRYYALYFETFNVKSCKYSENNHKKVNDLIKKNQLQSLSLHFSEQEYKGGNIPIRIDASVQVLICEKQKWEEDSKNKLHKNDVSFSVSAKYNSEKLEFLKQWIKEIFVQVDGINGYMDYLPSVHLAGVVNTTAYEQVSDSNASLFGDFCNKARGYFWITILTQRHIENLGGEKYVKENIPNYHIEEVKMKDGSATYFCQLTDDIFGFDKEKHLQLKEFLKPILDEENIKDINRVIYSAKSLKDSIEDRRLVFSEQQYKEIEEYTK